MREDMRNDMEELPEQGQAKNIMSRFKNMESENKSQVHHTPSKIASKVRNVLPKRAENNSHNFRVVCKHN